MITVLRSARVFDGTSEEYLDGVSVVIEGDRIKEVCDRKADFADARIIDCGGRVLMPGLIDAHFHAYTPSFDIIATDHMPQALLVGHATKILEGALSRGFTTVRGAAGGDIGLAIAIDAGLIKGPRFFFFGKAISQTGGRRCGVADGSDLDAAIHRRGNTHCGLRSLDSPYLCHGSLPHR
jgi:imidazolonepropionase-like amidohydrolase